MIIDILKWDLEISSFYQWISDNNIALYAINGYGGRGGYSTMYEFLNKDDFLAFNLKFARNPDYII